MACYNIKRHQIDQHHIIGDVGSYYQIQPCDEVSFLSPRLALKYPEFRNATGNPGILVKADFSGKNVPEEIGAAIGLSLECPFELRLRTVSYERQLEAG
ncbi:hypothetical protein HYFRA_00004923 [Hymenoscyphus fraxineus]|uniref:Uncharacterized protein n=1 Tax=Hymenoscyphus fraxineus TaxID=746836 RepID=A0A9N9PN22_9HELO|nr:hypothetical protein HYFRA_00004923 [Hymenoscyphus fraxineus]